MNIDWSKAPDWATEVGASTSGFAWVGNGNCMFFSTNVRRDLDDVRTHLRFWTIEHRQAEWSGEGLPPVGTVCEFAGGTPCPEDPFDKDLKEGMQVTIIAHFKSGDFTLAAFTFDPQNPDRGMVQVEQGNFGCFRPIRTAEQIAAEERAEAIKEMITFLGGDGDELINTFGRMYDAGYRKQESSQ